MRPSVAGFRRIGLGLQGAQVALGHDPADAPWCANQALISKFWRDSSLAVTAAVPLENGFNASADLFIRALGRTRLCRMIVAAAGQPQGGADPAHPTAGALSNALDHLPKLGRGL